jgi:hypothetical protein
MDWQDGLVIALTIGVVSAVYIFGLQGIANRVNNEEKAEVENS